MSSSQEDGLREFQAQDFHRFRERSLWRPRRRRQLLPCRDRCRRCRRGQGQHREPDLGHPRGRGETGGEHAMAEGRHTSGQRIQLLLHSPGLLPSKLLPKADEGEQEDHGGYKNSKWLLPIVCVTVWCPPHTLLPNLSLSAFFFLSYLLSYRRRSTGTRLSTQKTSYLTEHSPKEEPRGDIRLEEPPDPGCPVLLVLPVASAGAELESEETRRAVRQQGLHRPLRERLRPTISRGCPAERPTSPSGPGTATAPLPTTNGTEAAAGSGSSLTRRGSRAADRSGTTSLRKSATWNTWGL